MRRILAICAVAVVFPVAACTSSSDATTVAKSPTVARPSQAGVSASSPKAVEAIKSGSYAIIDVRTPAEFKAEHVKGAKNIDIQSADFVTEMKKLPKSGKYVVYCKSGNRSANAVAIMAKEGFGTVLDAGGIQSLKSQGVATA